MDTLSGSVERITFYNPENGYTVLRLRPEHQRGIHSVPKSGLTSDGLATVVGNLPEVSPGEFLQLQGQWDRHPRHGSQFKAEVCEQTLPDIHLNILKIADSLKISKEEMDDSLPKQIVSTGLFTLPICIKSLDVLKIIKPDFKKIKRFCNEIDIGSFHLFTFETIEPASVYHARNFAPVYGVNEDPVTGTANGAVCSYLVKNRIVQENNLLCEQGDIMGRPGRVFVEINKNNVKVGGRAKMVEVTEIKV